MKNANMKIWSSATTRTMLGTVGKRVSKDVYLNILDGRIQDGEVGRLLIVRGGGQLALEQLKALLEVRTPVLLQLVVHLACAGCAASRSEPPTNTRSLLFQVVSSKILQLKIQLDIFLHFRIVSVENRERSPIKTRRR